MTARATGSRRSTVGVRVGVLTRSSGVGVAEDIIVAVAVGARVGTGVADAAAGVGVALAAVVAVGEMTGMAGGAGEAAGGVWQAIQTITRTPSIKT